MTDSAQPTSILAQQLWFSKALHVEIRAAELPAPAATEVLVQSCFSAISAGTEMLVYRGQIPGDMALDASLNDMQKPMEFPLQYGYACVGRVLQTGADIDAELLNKYVFSFQPHASHFITTTDNLIVLPDDIHPEAAVFLANMETAVNLVQDGKPAIGEHVVVLGQGVVGLLLSSLLAKFPLRQLLAVDSYDLRRETALGVGVNKTFHPVDDHKELLELMQHQNGADLVFEVSGVPDALNLAIDLCGYASRIVIGSWYGNKTASVALGGAAHRNRLQISTSQVSTLAPELSGRWSKARRFRLGWDMIRRIEPQQFISHRAVLAEASEMYALLHESPDQVLQAVFTYNND